MDIIQFKDIKIYSSSKTLQFSIRHTRCLDIPVSDKNRGMFKLKRHAMLT